MKNIESYAARTNGSVMLNANECYKNISGEMVKELQEAIEESEAVKKLSEEEQKKHFKSIEAVFAELGWQDKRTEEEKWKDRFRRDSEIAENTRRLIRIFRK